MLFNVDFDVMICDYSWDFLENGDDVDIMLGFLDDVYKDICRSSSVFLGVFCFVFYYDDEVVDLVFFICNIFIMEISYSVFLLNFFLYRVVDLLMRDIREEIL